MTPRRPAILEIESPDVAHLRDAAGDDRGIRIARLLGDGAGDLISVCVEQRAPNQPPSTDLTLINQRGVIISASKLMAAIRWARRTKR